MHLIVGEPGQIGVPRHGRLVPRDPDERGGPWARVLGRVLPGDVPEDAADAGGLARHHHAREERAQRGEERRAARVDGGGDEGLAGGLGQGAAWGALGLRQELRGEAASALAACRRNGSLKTIGSIRLDQRGRRTRMADGRMSGRPRRRGEHQRMNDAARAPAASVARSRVKADTACSGQSTKSWDKASRIDENASRRVQAGFSPENFRGARFP